MKIINGDGWFKGEVGGRDDFEFWMLDFEWEEGEVKKSAE
jgi:hypothetical protein